MCSRVKSKQPSWPCRKCMSARWLAFPHETWGEAVKALIVLRRGESLAEEGVIAHCKKKLCGVKAPKSVEFLVEIPKTPAGKIDRKNLRAPYWQGTDRAVH